MGAGQPGSYLLRLFGAHVHQAFGEVPFQVGSSLTQKRGWRDVDVRLMLDDDEYAARYADDGVRNAHNLAWSIFGQHLTGLPIDFQIQERSQANAEHDGPRSALLLTTDDLPIVVVRRVGHGQESAA